MSSYCELETWCDRIDKVLVVICILLYVAAKLHFFTHYGTLSLGAYLEQHAWFWAAIAIVALVSSVLNWSRKRLQRSNSN